MLTDGTTRVPPVLSLWKADTSNNIFDFKFHLNDEKSANPQCVFVDYVL